MHVKNYLNTAVLLAFKALQRKFLKKILLDIFCSFDRSRMYKKQIVSLKR